MKPLDLDQLEELCNEVDRELRALGTPEACALGALIQDHIYTVHIVDAGVGLDPERRPALEADLAKVDELIAGARTQALAFLARHGLKIGANAENDDVLAAFDKLRDSGSMAILVHDQLRFADELRRAVAPQLAAVRAAAAGPKHAMAELQDALDRARKLLRPSR